jgi:pSer/pThr/pTyr-binding forkhead associated (FHA) protein
MGAMGAMGATMVLPTARLIGTEEGLTQEFHLGPVTFVGRTGECQVRIARPAVSRRHARIDLAADGAHLITDLQSENGTYVNGVRVNEQRLADGDRVAFGTVRFLYKAT